MKIELDVIRIVVLEYRDHTDSVDLVLNEQSPLAFEDRICLSFKLPAKTGVAFVRKRFGVEPEVIRA